MRIPLAAVALLALAGCATNEAASKAAAAPLAWCNPCTYPCTAPCAPPAPAVAAPAKPPYVPPPTPAISAAFDPAPGLFDGAQTVTLSSPTAGSVIHYTTDGTTPTEASPRYEGPLAVAATTTIRAIAVAPGLPSSSVSEGTYTIEPKAPVVPARVSVTSEKLELTEKVFFDTSKTTIKPVSYSLLDEVAQVLNAHPEVRSVAIEGHTDSTGSPATNTKLSQGRAEAVRTYLVDKGVAADRLTAKGYGPKRPIGDNATAEGREANRRVEFIISQ